MNTANEPDEKGEALERLIDRTLRAQPAIPAPRTLQARVFAEIERRAALPWWQNSFLHWPLPARGVFLLASLVIVKFALQGVMWLTESLRAAPVTDALSAPVTWFHTARSIASSLTGVAIGIFDSIPSYWLYAGAFAGVAAYVAFFGLGAALYRTLYK